MAHRQPPQHDHRRLRARHCVHPPHGGPLLSIHRWVAAGALALAAVLGACGNGDPQDDQADPTARSTAPDKPAATVVVDSLAYKPAKVSISAGETVLWRFRDGVKHDVKGDGFKSPLQAKGTFTRAFDEAGTYPYICTVHPTMKGTVEVT